jgi:hypothetical protein
VGMSERERVFIRKNYKFCRLLSPRHQKGLVMSNALKVSNATFSHILTNFSKLIYLSGLLFNSNNSIIVLFERIIHHILIIFGFAIFENLSTILINNDRVYSKFFCCSGRLAKKSDISEALGSHLVEFRKLNISGIRKASISRGVIASSDHF